MTDATKADAAAAARTLTTSTDNIIDAITQHEQTQRNHKPLSTGLNTSTPTHITKGFVAEVLRGEATL